MSSNANLSSAIYSSCNIFKHLLSLAIWNHGACVWFPSYRHLCKIIDKFCKRCKIFQTKRNWELLYLWWRFVCHRSFGGTWCLRLQLLI